MRRPFCDDGGAPMALVVAPHSAHAHATPGRSGGRALSLAGAAADPRTTSLANHHARRRRRDYVAV